MAAARAILKQSEAFMNAAYANADSTRAMVADLRAKGYNGPQLQKALQEANNAQRKADKARNTLEAARKQLDAQPKSKPISQRTADMVTAASESANIATEAG